MGYQAEEYRAKSPSWYVHYAGVLDGSGLPKIAAGPFETQSKAQGWIASQIEWERSLDNPSRWD